MGAQKGGLLLSDDTHLLQRQLSELVDWERIKRREQILLTAFSYSLLVSLPVLPVRTLLPAWISPLYFPLISFLLLAPFSLLLQPWREKESLRALSALDHSVRLEERAITAWEILARRDRSIAEEYVLHEAGEKLTGVDVKALFRRQWSWHALLAPPLLVLWLALVWLNVGVDFGAGANGAKPVSVAQKLKEFSQELREKAEAQRLPESLKIARALQELAEERLKGKASDEKLGENLAAMRKQVEETAAVPGESDLSLGAYTRDALSALKTELEALKGLQRPGSTMSEKELLERLAPMARLSEAMEQRRGPIGKLSAQELKSLLGKLEQDVTDELDRRSLAEVRDFLTLLLRGGEAGDVPVEALTESGQAQRRPSQEEKGGRQGDFAGDQPGVKGKSSQPPPFSAGAATRLQGILSEGKSVGLTWRGEAKAGASKIPEQEAAASYRRQVEEELASEKIPPGLKETVKKYFLSLGMKEENK